LEVKKLEDRRQILRSWIRSYFQRLITIGVDPKRVSTAAGLITGTTDTTEQLTKELLEEVRQWHDELILPADFEDLDEPSDDRDSESDLTLNSTLLDDDHNKALAIPETVTIWMPSYDQNAKANLKDLELELRKAQASDALHMVKVKIGEKSVLIRHVVRRNRDAGQYRKG
jgi:hypothetical protein